MNHERCSESLGPWLRGELPASEAQEVAAHLEGCADCARERDALGLLFALEVEPLGDEERTRLERALLAQRRAEVIAWAPTRPSWRARLAPALGAAALIALVSVGAVYVGMNGGSDDEQAAPEAGAGVAPTPTTDVGLEREGLRDEGKKRPKKAGAQTLRSAATGALETGVPRSEKSETRSGTTTTAGSDAAPFSEGSEEADISGEGGGGGGGEPAPAPAEGQAKAMPDKVSIGPTNDTAEVGSCNAFVVTVTDPDDQPVEGVSLDVEQRHELAEDDTSGNEPQVGFCTPGGSNPSAVDEGAGDLGPPEEDPDNVGTAGGETAATTNGDGQITIGIEVAPANGSDGSGEVTLVTFFDTSGDDDPGSDEPRDTATNTWVTPGQRSSSGRDSRASPTLRSVAWLFLGIF